MGKKNGREDAMAGHARRAAIVGTPLLFAVTLALSLLPVAAPAEDMMYECLHADDPDQRAEACTSVLGETNNKKILRRALNGRGLALCSTAERCPEAVRDFAEVVRLAPLVAGFWDNYARALRAAKRYGEAIAASDEAIRLAPSLGFTYYGKGRTLEVAGRLEEALATTDGAIVAVPTDAGLWEFKGQLLTELRRLPAAYLAFDRALTLQPGRASVYLRRADAELAEGRLDDAIEDLSRYPGTGTYADQVRSKLRALQAVSTEQASTKPDHIQADARTAPNASKNEERTNPTNAFAPAQPSMLKAQENTLLRPPRGVVASADTPTTKCDEEASYKDDPQKKAPGKDIISIDPDSAIEACERAIVRYPNEIRLKFQLGRAYLAGYRCAKSYSILEGLANQGYAYASVTIGFMLENGKCIGRDYPKAFSSYQNAAEKGNASGEAALCAMFIEGKGVHKDYSKALDLCRNGSEKGNANAMYLLGYMYFKGIGVISDKQIARDYFTKSALRDHQGAQLMLGHMFENGIGVKKDLYEAARLYGLAADQKNAEAQTRLGLLRQSQKEDIDRAVYEKLHADAEVQSAASEEAMNCGSAFNREILYGLVYRNSMGIYADLSGNRVPYAIYKDVNLTSFTTISRDKGFRYCQMLVEYGGEYSAHHQQVFTYHVRASDDGKSQTISEFY